MLEYVELLIKASAIILIAVLISCLIVGASYYVSYEITKAVVIAYQEGWIVPG